MAAREDCRREAGRVKRLAAAHPAATARAFRTAAFHLPHSGIRRYRVGGGSTVQTIQGKRVLVTGGASGIGKAIAQRFARDQAHMVLLDLNETALAEAASAMTGAASVATYRADVTDAAGLRAVRDRIHADGGPIDVLVNNAGIVFGGPFLDVPLEKHATTFRVNVEGLVAMTHVFLPDLHRPARRAHRQRRECVGLHRPAVRHDLRGEQVGGDRVQRVVAPRTRAAGAPPRPRDDDVPELREHGPLRGRAPADVHEHAHGRAARPTRPCARCCRTARPCARRGSSR